MADHITFIGLGAMGYGMASNLRKKMDSSQTLFVYDVVRESCERFQGELGEYGPVEIVDSPAAGVDKSRTLVTIVPKSENVREVYLDGPGAVINATKGDRLVLECSTIDVQTTREVGAKVAEAGLGMYLDAPVSGGPIGAANGTLSFLLGQSDEDTATASRITQIVHMMANPGKVVFCGGLGTGLVAKICNNYLSFCNMLSIAESMSMGVRLGIDKHVLFKCISNSGGNSATFHNFQPCPGVIPHLPSSNRFKAGFRPFMIVKDLSLGVEAGAQAGVQTTMAEAALETYRKAMEDPRCRDRDATSVWLMINGLTDEDVEIS
ncbi:NAD binding domain of 6-phosphogluconate dehydrogenase-domain-containing protein [Aspergillus pseudoustus]|uniref:NAD binding domain of 6-phosphogluconate dehydrogenase-domain-containing protein n=1 Tax=Aspergillus pseudoustus TaxID=1810923 RepID=A0ABR4IBJ6_9EURO